MDVDTPSTPVTSWDRLLQGEPMLPEIKREVEAGLGDFGKKKTILLDRLRAAACMLWLPGFSQPAKLSDEQAAWRRLIDLAAMYFLWHSMPSARERVKGLRKLAKALDQVCSVAEQVMQDNAGSDLVSQLFDGVLPREPAGRLVCDQDGTLRPVYFPATPLKEIVRGLNEHKAAILRAASDVPSRQSGKRPVLPESYIGALADVYLDCTGRMPGAGTGPFYRFVLQFRGALDPSYKTRDATGDERLDESLIEDIKDALRRWRRARGSSTKRAQGVRTNRG